MLLQSSSKLSISRINVLLQIFSYLNSVGLINGPNSFTLFFSCFMRNHIRPYPKISPICKPYCSILIFQEFTFHSQDFHLVKFRYIKTHFVNLFQTIAFSAIRKFYQIFIITNRSVIIFNLLFRILTVNRSEKVNHDWSSTTPLGFNTGLNGRN